MGRPTDGGAPAGGDPQPGDRAALAWDAPRLAGLASRLHSVAIGLLRRVRPVDRESALSAARLSALSVIVFAGPLTLRDLAEAEQVTSPTMSRLVSGLEREGLARRRAHPEDGRALLVEATGRGRRLLERGRARRVERLVETTLAGLRAADLAALERAVAILERAVVDRRRGEAPGGAPPRRSTSRR